VFQTTNFSSSLPSATRKYTYTVLSRIIPVIQYLVGGSLKGSVGQLVEYLANLQPVGKNNMRTPNWKGDWDCGSSLWRSYYHGIFLELTKYLGDFRMLSTENYSLLQIRKIWNYRIRIIYFLVAYAICLLGFHLLHIFHAGSGIRLLMDTTTNCDWNNCYGGNTNL
jgi:hypothetical protein